MVLAACRYPVLRSSLSEGSVPISGWSFVYSCIAFSFMRCRTAGQNVPFAGCSIFDAGCGVFCVGCLASGVVLLFCVAPLSSARASRAFTLISSSRSLLVQNHISSDVVFRMYRVPFSISCGVWALSMMAAARPVR